MAFKTSTSAAWTILSSSAVTPKGLCRPSAFGNIRPPGGLRSVCASLQPIGKVLEIGLQVLAVLLPRHPIDPRSRLRIQAEVGSP